MRLKRLDDSGVVAVEFALVSPVLIFLGLGALVAGQYLAVAHNVQQVVNEAARYSVAAGPSTDGRLALVEDYIDQRAGDQSLIDPEYLTATVVDVGEQFHRVTITYATDGLLIHQFANLLSFGGETIERSAVVRAGGV